MSWIPQDSSLGAGEGLCALNGNVALYANYTGQPAYTRGIRRTTDGGETWETVDTAGLYYTDIEFVDAQLGFAVGGTLGSPIVPVVRKTSDGGATWTTIWNGPAGFEIEGVSFVGTLLGWAVTYDGLMYHTTDGGYSWSFQDSLGQGVPMRDVQFTSVDSGWAVGGIAGDNVIARTTDAGTTWTYIQPGGSSLREIAMVNSRLGWFTGWGNFSPFIARTSDGGETWETQEFSPPDNLGFESICMVNESLGWLCGEGGKVFRTTNGGVTFVAELPRGVPAEAVLHQNYPNPFNPSTTIRYGLPSRSHVTLTVFNTLGQQVATLVDGEMEAGYHEAMFGASGLSSGVYLYRLTAGSFVQTRRLVFIR